MIVCPRCNSPTGVRETRSHGNYLRRRRVCDNTACGFRVTTIEAVVDVAGGKSARHDGEMVIVPRKALEDIVRLVGGAIGFDQIIAFARTVPLPGADPDDG